VGATVLATVLATALAAPAAAAPGEGTILRAGGPTAVAGSYIVVFKDTAVSLSGVAGRSGELATRFGGTVGRTYSHALRGFEAKMSEASAKRLALDPAVRYVQQNHTVRASGIQSPTPSWGLDRIDQRNLPLSNTYTYPNTGAGVTAYVIDTGIVAAHTDFGGRGTTGYNAIPDPDWEEDSVEDCHGHGTHVAGTIGGNAHGVAKDVRLVAVRVLDCGGSGTFAGVIGGVDWVTWHHQPGQPAVANMSLGGGSSQALNDAVTASIADGVVYTLAAGNDFAADACTVSPAGTPNGITVGATERDDARAEYSNTGSCLDIFAPGSAITASWYGGHMLTATISGTSMAAPHVAGAAALVLAANPTFTPQQVRDKLVNDAVTGMVTDPGAGSPNKLLNVSNIAPPGRDFSVAVSATAASVNPGGSTTATVSTATTAGAPHPVTLSVTGLPSGATVSFSPSSVTSGGSATVTLSATAATAAGTYLVLITGTGPESIQIATYSLTVTGPAGCAQSTNQDVRVPSLHTVEGVLTIWGCAGNAAANSTVEVHIVHYFRTELVVTLIAPDGTTYPLHNQTGEFLDHNLDRTYTLNLSGKVANGTWRVRVQDAVGGNLAGYLNSWTLNLRPSPPPAGVCTRTNGTDVAIPRSSTVESTLTFSGCSGSGWASSTVEVHLVHGHRGGLVVTLVAPDGSTYVLHDRTEGDALNLDQTYTLNLSSEARNGTWRLRVSYVYIWELGRIDTWTLTL
jgi:subtilisin family serine protease/subtilisin-like proprotein convertase family protein